MSASKVWHANRDACLAGMGGALVSPDTLETDQKKLVGSGMMFEDESADAVRKILKEDIYWMSNVVSNASQTLCVYS